MDCDHLYKFLTPLYKKAPCEIKWHRGFREAAQRCEQMDGRQVITIAHPEPVAQVSLWFRWAKNIYLLFPIFSFVLFIAPDKHFLQQKIKWYFAQLLLRSTHNMFYVEK